MITSGAGTGTNTQTATQINTYEDLIAAVRNTQEALAGLHRFDTLRNFVTNAEELIQNWKATFQILQSQDRGETEYTFEIKSDVDNQYQRSPNPVALENNQEAAELSKDLISKFDSLLKNLALQFNDLDDKFQGVPNVMERSFRSALEELRIEETLETVDADYYSRNNGQSSLRARKLSDFQQKFETALRTAILDTSTIVGEAFNQELATIRGLNDGTTTNETSQLPGLNQLISACNTIRGDGHFEATNVRSTLMMLDYSLQSSHSFRNTPMGIDITSCEPKSLMVSEQLLRTIKNLPAHTFSLKGYESIGPQSSQPEVVAYLEAIEIAINNTNRFVYGVIGFQGSELDIRQAKHPTPGDLKSFREQLSSTLQALLVAPPNNFFSEEKITKLLTQLGADQIPDLIARAKISHNVSMTFLSEYRNQLFYASSAHENWRFSAPGSNYDSRSEVLDYCLTIMSELESNLNKKPQRFSRSDRDLLELDQDLQELVERVELAGQIAFMIDPINEEIAALRLKLASSKLTEILLQPFALQVKHEVSSGRPGILDRANLTSTLPETADQLVQMWQQRHTPVERVPFQLFSVSLGADTAQKFVTPEES